MGKFQPLATLNQAYFDWCAIDEPVSFGDFIKNLEVNGWRII